NSSFMRRTSSLAVRRAAGLGRRSASGISFTRSMAVGTEARAVTALIAPDSQYMGYQIVQISMKCVVPQATMKIAKQTNIQLNSRSLRRRTKYRSVKGIEK